MTKINKVFWSILILFLGLSVFLIQMTFSGKLPVSYGLFIKIGISAILLIISFFYFQRQSKSKHGKIFYLFFTASTAILVSSLIGNWALILFGLDTNSYIGIAVAKFSESLPIVLLIIFLARIIDIRYDSLYLTKGKLKSGLLIGILFFVGFTILTIFTGNMIPLFHDKLQNKEIVELIKLIPWTLLFVLSNGFMEELLVRGLFLKHFESIIGFRLSNILTAIIFSLAHLQVQYAPHLIGFLIIVFFLGLLLGNVMKKTNSIIAPALIHAGADVMLILPMFTKYL